MFEDWVIVPKGMTNEILIELMKPLEPLYIRRNELGTTVRYLSSSYDQTNELQAKLRSWSGEYEAIETERRRRESDARFAAYLKTLDLDDFIEIPIVYHYPDGTPSEYTVYQMKA